MRKRTVESWVGGPPDNETLSGLVFNCTVQPVSPFPTYFAEIILTSLVVSEFVIRKLLILKVVF